LRVATMILYCTAPTSGGATNFRQAGIHIQPRKQQQQQRDALFFSYVNPETMTMDRTGLTEHSGCPVYGGTKQIVTQWIRHGVTTDLPWQAFDGNGKKRDDSVIKTGLMLQQLTKEDIERAGAFFASAKPEKEKKPEAWSGLFVNCKCPELAEMIGDASVFCQTGYYVIFQL